MKRKSIKLFLFFLILNFLTTSAQQNIKVLYYKNRAPSKKVEQRIDGDFLDEYTEALFKQGDHFELTANNGKSYYRLLDDAKEIYVERTVGYTTNAYVIYKNPVNVFIDQQQRKLTSQYTFHDEKEKFLIHEALEPIKWEITDETKTISGYTCTLAKATYKDIEHQLKETELYAWYTDEIPVNLGPEHFWGLPGLILKVQKGYQEIITAKKITFIENASTTKPPVEGKVISAKKFEEFVIEKFAPKKPIIIHN